MQKLPPIEKIYKTYRAIADWRVILLAEQSVILSLSRAKEDIVSEIEQYTARMIMLPIGRAALDTRCTDAAENYPLIRALQTGLRALTGQS